MSYPLATEKEKEKGSVTIVPTAFLMEVSESFYITILTALVCLSLACLDDRPNGVWKSVHVVLRRTSL